jgi:hypothetical protein
MKSQLIPIMLRAFPKAGGTLSWCLYRFCRVRQRIAAAVIPERRSLVRDRKKSKRLPFCDPGSRFAWPG